MGTELAVIALHERTERIVGHMERAAIDIGRELIEAKAEHPGEFIAWIVRELPFSVDKAHRLMAIARALGSVPEEVRAQLPKAWTVLFELSKVDPDIIETGVSEGVLSPSTTRAEAEAFHREKVAGLLGGPAPPTVQQPWSRGLKKGQKPYDYRLKADTVARELVRLPRTDLTPQTEALLREWLEGDSDGVDG